MSPRIAVLSSLAALTLIGCAGSAELSPGTTTGAFNRIWGSSEAAFVDGDATVARFSNPANVEVGPDGTTYVADYDNNVVRAISPGGIVSTLVSQANFGQPFGLAMGPGGVLYVQTDVNDLGAKDPTTGTVWAVNTATGATTVVARNLGRPRGLVVLSDGRIAMADIAHQVVSILDPTLGLETPLAGQEDTPGFVNGTGTLAQFDRPYGLDVAPDGALLVADQNNNVIRRVSLAGDVTTFAGSGAQGAANGTRATAEFDHPQDVAVFGSRVFVDDHNNHLIRLISGDTVSVFAGDGTAGFFDGTGTSARFFGQEGIALTPDGSILWIADGNNGDGDPFNRVRRLKTGL